MYFKRYSKEILLLIFVKFIKKNAMLQKISVLFILAGLLAFPSCVSKKKYLEMEAGRLRAEALSRQLDEENNQKAARIEALIADFESMKNELLENNAIKDHYIDSLNGEIFALTENLKVQKESLKETSYTLGFEQQRLADAIAEKERNIAALRREVEQKDNEIAARNSEIDQRNFDLGRVKEEAVLMQGKLKSGDQKVIELQAELQQVKNETGKLRADLKEKDAVILRLENNVKLLKKELGQ